MGAKVLVSTPNLAKARKDDKNRQIQRETCLCEIGGKKTSEHKP